MIARTAQGRNLFGKYPELESESGQTRTLSDQIQKLVSDEFQKLASDQIQKLAEGLDDVRKLESENKVELEKFKQAFLDISSKLPVDEVGPPILVKSQRELPTSNDVVSTLTESVPVELTSVVDVMRRARHIIDLPPNWDGEDGIGCDEATWKRAFRIVVDHATNIWTRFQKVSCPYRVTPDLEGGLDIHWRSGQLELLMNVPPDADEVVAFFGNDRSKPTSCKTSGELAPGESVSLGVTSWLVEMN